MKIQTVAVHAGSEPDPETGALTRPIHLSTTSVGPTGAIRRDPSTPEATTTREALESCLSQLGWQTMRDTTSRPYR